MLGIKQHEIRTRMDIKYLVMEPESGRKIIRWFMVRNYIKLT